MASKPYQGRRSAEKRRRVNLGGRNYDSSKSAKTVARKRVKTTLVEKVTPPNWMTPVEKNRFNHVLDVVLSQGTCRNTDVLTLELMCTEYVQYHDICKTIAQEGFMVEQVLVKGGTRQIPHPLIPLRESMKKSLASAFRSFGMTPASRRLIIAEEAAEDAIDKEAEEWAGLVNGKHH